LSMKRFPRPRLLTQSQRRSIQGRSKRSFVLPTAPNETAAPPAPPAASAPAAATPPAAATTAYPKADATAAAAAAADKLHHRRCTVATFSVEDVEGRQANVRDFFLTEEDLIAISVA